MANFDGELQSLNLDDVNIWSGLQQHQLIDLYSGRSPDIFKNTLVIPGFGFYWLSRM